MAIDGGELHTILSQNRELIIRKNMVEKGNTREQAESDVAGLLLFTGCIDEGTLSVARDGGHPQATLELKLKLPTTLP